MSRPESVEVGSSRSSSFGFLRMARAISSFWRTGRSRSRTSARGSMKPRPEILEMGDRDPLSLAAPCDEGGAPNGLGIEQQVLRDREVANLSHLLERRLDPAGLRSARIVEGAQLSVDADLTRVRLDEPAQDLDHR